MYIVRDRATRTILHVNPAPLSQRLEGADIYHRYDPATMEVGRGELAQVPRHFDIDERGFIVPWTVQREVEAGVRALPPEQKAIGDRIVEKTLAEKVAGGIVTLRPTEKLAGDRIEQKTVAEQVAEGIIELGRTQVLDGDRIREKTRAELARDKLIELEPDEKLEGGAVIKLPPRRMLDEKRYDLQRYKEVVTERHAAACLAARRQVLPDHELLYAAIGALDAARVEQYRATVSGFVKALDQVKQAIQRASTADEVDAVPASYLRSTEVGPRPR